MALERQVIPVNFASSLDNKTAEEILPPGKLLVCENGLFRKIGRIEKRYGFSSYSKNILGGGTLASGNKLDLFKSDLLLFNNTNVYSYISSSDQWLNKGSITPVTVDSTPIIRNTSTQAMPDIATYSGLTVSVWEDSRGGVHMSAFDDLTGSPIYYDYTLSSSGTRPKVITVGSNFVMVWNEGQTLKSSYLSFSNPQSVSAAATFATNVLPAAAANQLFDLTPVNTNIGAIFYANAAGGATLAYISNTGTTASSSYPSPLTSPFPATVTVACLTVYYDPINIRFWVAYADSAANYNITVATTNQAFTATDLNTSVAYYNSATDTVRNITGGQPVGTTTQYGGITQPNAFTVYYEQGVTTGTLASAKNHKIAQAVYTWTPGTLSTVGSTILIRSVGLASKTFSNSSGVFFAAAYDSLLQPTYFIVCSDGRIVAKMAPGYGGGLTRDTNGTLKTGLCNVPMNAVGNFLLPIQIRNKLVANNSGIVLSANDGLNKATLNFSTVAFNGAQLSDNYHFAGGAVQNYDSVGVTEHGFHVYPEDVTITTVTATSTLSGAYSYKFMYEWVDGKGQIHRSNPSVAAALPAPGTVDNTKKIQLVVPKLRVTAKTNGKDPAIVVYRTTAGGSVYYRLDQVSNGFLGTVGRWTTNADTVTFLDAGETTDATLSVNEILYTTGGVAAAIAPPAAKIVYKHKNRVFLAGLEDENLVWYSRQSINYEGIAFNDAFIFRVDAAGGGITALGTLDEKLVIFKKTNIFYVSGDGPLDTGFQNTFSVPQLIPSDVGTANPNSVAVIPPGIIFKSDKGIYLLNRQLQVQYIGAPVQDFNGYTITSASVMPDVNQVRFTTSNGPTLVYDYFFGEWTTFTNYTAQSSVVWSGQFVHLKPDGTVNHEVVGQYNDNGAKISLNIVTAWISLNQLQGYQRLYEVGFLGKLLGDCAFQIKVAYDFEDLYNETAYFKTSSMNRGYFGNDGYFGGTSTFGDSATGVPQFRFKPARQKCEAIKIQLTDIDTTALGAGGLALTNLAFLVGAKTGVNKPGLTGKMVGSGGS